MTIIIEGKIIEVERSRTLVSAVAITYRSIRIRVGYVTKLS